jgi:hypothetical protein
MGSVMPATIMQLTVTMVDQAFRISGYTSPSRIHDHFLTENVYYRVESR